MSLIHIKLSITAALADENNGPQKNNEKKGGNVSHKYFHYIKEKWSYSFKMISKCFSAKQYNYRTANKGRQLNRQIW